MQGFATSSFFASLLLLAPVTRQRDQGCMDGIQGFATSFLPALFAFSQWPSSETKGAWMRSSCSMKGKGAA